MGGLRQAGGRQLRSRATSAIGDTGPTWTWEALTNEFLRYKRPKLKKAYQEQYEHYLRLTAFKTIEKKLVSEVTLGDLERVRDAIEKELAPSAVHRALTQSKRMLSWAWKFHATRSGLEACEYEWWLRWSYEYKTKRRTRAPTIEEIARTLLLAENAASLCEGGRHPHPGTLGALWAVTLTAQRTGSLLLLRPDRMFVAENAFKKLRGWLVANWTAEEMKGGRDGGRSHSLPIPKEAVAILKRFRQQGGPSSPWMFPSRERAKHVTQDALNRLIYRMQGREYGETARHKPARPGKPGPKPKRKRKHVDLFMEFGIRPWTPHDVRRTLTTFLDDHRLGGAATAILGHKLQGENVSERERTAPITELHYNQSQKIDLKADGMALWVKELLRVCKLEARKLSDRLKELRVGGRAF
jgi:integrase